MTRHEVAVYITAKSTVKQWCC